MPPPLPSEPLGTYLTGTPPSPPPRIEIACYLDLVCPFSTRMYATLRQNVLPRLHAAPLLKEAVSIQIYHVIQPWHPQSTLVHEAALAVKKFEGTPAYLQYLSWIGEQFSGPDAKFSDTDTWSKSREQIYRELLACFSAETAAKILTLLNQPKQGATAVGNCGNGVTQDIKWHCKHHRAMGVHVTPTVFCNGIEAVQVSSGWTADEWMAFFESL